MFFACCACVAPQLSAACNPIPTISPKILKPSIRVIQAPEIFDPTYPVIPRLLLNSSRVQLSSMGNRSVNITERFPSSAENKSVGQLQSELYNPWIIAQAVDCAESVFCILSGIRKATRVARLPKLGSIRHVECLGSELQTTNIRDREFFEQ